MFNKRGMSQIVTTVIIVVLVLVAIGIVWGVVGNLISESSDDVSINSFTIGLGLEKVLLEEDSIIIDVKRKSGEGEIVGIGFILNDGINSEIIEKTTDLQELEVNSFILEPEELSISTIKDISIYPIYSSGSKEKKGNVVDNINMENLEVPVCGNNTKEAGEECDDGNAIETDRCSNNCTLTLCGDGFIQSPNGFNLTEECDDGNLINEDGCDNGCQEEPIIICENYCDLECPNGTVQGSCGCECQGEIIIIF